MTLYSDLEYVYIWFYCVVGPSISSIEIDCVSFPQCFNRIIMHPIYVVTSRTSKTESCAIASRYKLTACLLRDCFAIRNSNADRKSYKHNVEYVRTFVGMNFIPSIGDMRCMR